MKLKMLNDFIVTLKIEEEPGRGKILLQHKNPNPKRKVLGVGKLVQDVKEGDTIICDRFAGMFVEQDGKEFTVVKEKDVLGVLCEQVTLVPGETPPIYRVDKFGDKQEGVTHDCF